jgi:hypothetical protein
MRVFNEARCDHAFGVAPSLTAIVSQYGSANLAASLKGPYHIGQSYVLPPVRRLEDILSVSNKVYTKGRDNTTESSKRGPVSYKPAVSCSCHVKQSA